MATRDEVPTEYRGFEIFRTLEGYYARAGGGMIRFGPFKRFSVLKKKVDEEVDCQRWASYSELAPKR